jgi:hypothetical protein
MRRRTLTLAIATVIGLTGLVVAVLGIIAAIDTWVDVNDSRTEFKEEVASEEVACGKRRCCVAARSD